MIAFSLMQQLSHSGPQQPEPKPSPTHWRGGPFRCLYHFQRMSISIPLESILPWNTDFGACFIPYHEPISSPTVLRLSLSMNQEIHEASPTQQTVRLSKPTARRLARRERQCIGLMVFSTSLADMIFRTTGATNGSIKTFR